MNTVVKNKAANWAEKHNRWSPFNKDKEFYDSLRNELSIFHFAQDRLDFINHFQSLMQNRYDEHVKTCKNKLCKAYTKIDVINFYSDQEKEIIRKQIENEKQKAEFKTYIENVTIGGENQIVNLGEMHKNIIKNSQELIKGGADEISTALNNLANAIKESSEINETQKSEYLETVKILSDEALKPTNTRMSKPVLKRLIKFGLGSLNNLGSLASITGQTLPQIIEFFLK